MHTLRTLRPAAGVIAAVASSGRILWLFVFSVLVSLPEVSLGQVRGGGVSRSTADPPRERRAAPAQPFESRLSVRPRPFRPERIPRFVLWFGYLSFYPWAEEWAFADAADTEPPPLPPPAIDVPTGGLQLDVTPRSTRVYVDGFYAGVADDFSGYYRHLTLPAGPHLIDLVAPGYEPESVSVVVPTGQTTTHRSTLGWTTNRR